MNKVKVSASKEYEVLIGQGLLKNCGELIKPHLKTDKVFIVTDDKVSSLYLDTLKNALKQSDISSAEFIFPNGEQSKSADTYIKLLNVLAENKINRADTLIALGGGVVGDLTGFAAATFLRGIGFIQIPTTLLSAVDSSVGGKTAIDLDAGKNLAGAFYQPSVVICDTDTLSTLDETNYKCGMAEVIKYGILCDKEFFDKLLSRDISNEDIITKCVQIKSDVVKDDEFDTGRRKLLNLGHTIGHAIESLSKYQTPHGLAVAIGMNYISKIAYNNGLCDERTVTETEEILKAYGLPLTCDYTLDEIISKLTSDKKVEGEKIDLIIPEHTGKCVIYPLPLSKLEAFIKKGETK